MICQLKDTVDIEKDTQINLYISWKDLEIDNVNKIINYAAEQSNTQSHITFLKGYQNIIQDHISTFRKSIERAKELSVKLEAYLNELDINASLGSNDMFEIKGTQFYTSYNRGEFSFITQIVYDHYSKMNIHAVFAYQYNGNGLITGKKYIGFTDEKIENLIKYPTSLIEEINKMDEEDYYEDVNARYKKCEKLLCNCLNVKDPMDLFEYDDPYFKLFWGEPIDLLRNMGMKRTYNVIKLQLESKIAEEVTENLISLIKTEIALKKDYQKYDENSIFYGRRDLYDKTAKRLTDKKKSLMDNAGVNQETLDKYLSYIVLDDE